MHNKTLDISVIIPFYNKAKMTIDCVKSLYKFGPQVKEVILINNNSSQEELITIKNFIVDYKNIKLLDYLEPFNYQKLNNWAAGNSKGKFILFLNNDTELVEKSRNLIEKMYQKASEKNIGAVGCLLLYGDKKTVQHGGVYLIEGGLADHIAVGQKYKPSLKDTPIGLNYNKDKQLVAVTGAVTMVEKKKFIKVDGFDEKFIVCGGDVDLCIRLNKAGFKTWYLGSGYILHKESQSRRGQKIPHNDFILSYKSYMTIYDEKNVDPFVGKYLYKEQQSA